MPTIQFAGKTIECPTGANLRSVLLRARLPLYHRVARAVHCRGRGSCGTCAVQIEGEVSEPTDTEIARLSRAPHNSESNLRLACQCNVLGDLKITKYQGVFGHKDDVIDTEPDDASPVES